MECLPEIDVQPLKEHIPPVERFWILYLQWVHVACTHGDQWVVVFIATETWNWSKVYYAVIRCMVASYHSAWASSGQIPCSYVYMYTKGFL